MEIRKILAQQLRQVADNLDAGNTNLTQEDALEIISTICNVSISKSEVASELNTCVSNVDKLVASGRLNRSHKRKGITERLWYLKDVLYAKNILARK